MWQLGKACVIIRIKGKHLEHMLNALRGEGVTLSHVIRLSSEELRLCMPAKDFVRVRRHANKLRLRVHIESRSGAPFLVMRLLQRRTLWISCLAGLVLLLAASTRIWFVSVEGNERIATSTVQRALKENGLYAGAAKPASTLEALADAIQAYDERIAWVGLDLDGVCLRVSVREAEYDMLAIDPQRACNVVAVKDGIIREIRALNGVAVQLPGEMAHAGDVLISGVVELDDIPEPMLVHARGSVLAEVHYFSEYAEPLSGERLCATGQTAPYRRVSICGLTLYESVSPYAEYVLSGCEETRIRFPLLPVSVCGGVYEQWGMQTVALTPAEAAETALVEAEKGALMRIPTDAAITYKTSGWQETEGVVIATCAVSTIESIGMTKEIENGWK